MAISDWNMYGVHGRYMYRLGISLHERTNLMEEFTWISSVLVDVCA